MHSRESDWLGTGECREQLDYWKNELAEVPGLLQIPIDFPRPRTPNIHGKEVHFTIDTTLRDKILILARKHNTGLNIPLLAAFSILLSRYSLQDDLVIGVPFPNRNREELQSLIGVLVNTLPLRFSFTGEMTFSECCRAGQKTVPVCLL